MKKSFDIIQGAVEKELSCSAHNMDHVWRVYHLALRLAKNQKVNLDILKAAVLLHDIARIKEDNDSSGQTDHAVLSAKMAAPILKKTGFNKEEVKHVQDCIVSHRYRTGHTPQTIEAKILFDADKLDTAGAIGIARCFMWVALNNARIYRDIDAQEYAKENLGGKLNGRIQDKTKHSPQIEFKTKLIFLKDKLNTPQAKKICRERLQFYESFLKRLEKEIKGEK